MSVSASAKDAPKSKHEAITVTPASVVGADFSSLKLQLTLSASMKLAGSHGRYILQDVCPVSRFCLGQRMNGPYQEAFRWFLAQYLVFADGQHGY